MYSYKQNCPAIRFASYCQIHHIQIHYIQIHYIQIHYIQIYYIQITNQIHYNMTSKLT